MNVDASVTKIRMRIGLATDTYATLRPVVETVQRRGNLAAQRHLTSNELHKARDAGFVIQ